MEISVVQNGSPSISAGGKLDCQQAMEKEVEDLRGFRLLFISAHVVGGILMILMTIYSVSYKGGFAWRSNIHLEFNWHPFLTTIGMVYLLGNGLLMFRSLRTMRKRSLKITHATVLFIAFIISLIGIIAAFDAKNFAVPQKINLHTLHSWLGIITFVGFALQWVAGFVTFLWSGLAAHLRGALLPFHKYFGLVIFIMSCVSAATGFAEKKRGPGYEGLIINQMGLILMLFALIVIYLVINLPYKRRPRAED